MKFYFVYILKCSDASYYVGITSNLDRRVSEHNAGKYPDAYTHSRRPVELVWYQEFLEPNQAYPLKRKLKNGVELRKKL